MLAMIVTSTTTHTNKNIGTVSIVGNICTNLGPLHVQGIGFRVPGSVCGGLPNPSHVYTH